ncbi:MAG: zinc-ribbon domain containing protein [Dehalococcoidia bacterium]
MPFADRILVCRDCGGNFTFTSGEQTFYNNRGLTNDPARCAKCRSARKSAPPGAPADISPLGRGYVNYGPFASFGGRTPRQMHPATCDHCGEVTEVPFVPKGDRPVYCSGCFSQVRTEPEDVGHVRDRRTG